MANRARKSARNVLSFAIMGATGTGKSTFIRLLTNDDKIRIGHNQESETSLIETANYIDQATGRHVVLVDTPGFDDSREDITDADILQKIIDYLEPEKGKSRKLNGIIYMHRISDPRLSGVSRKNLEIFQSLCGDKNFGNVRIITTNWDRVTEQEGIYREADLRNGAFRPLIDTGAQMHRLANTVESASQIMSKLIPLPEITTAIQEEVQAGMTLAETGAGRVLMAEMQAIQKKYEREMVELRKELETAVRESDQTLRAELELEHKALEAKVQRIEDDRAKLGRTLDERREGQRKRREEENAEPAQLERQWAEKCHELSAQLDAARESIVRLEEDATKREAEAEQRIADADRKAAMHIEHERATARAAYERRTNMAAEESSRARAEYKALEEKIKRVEAERAKLERTLDEQREADLKEEKAARARLETLWVEERRELSAQLDAARESIARLEKDAAKRQTELEQQIAGTNRKAAELREHERAAARAAYERQTNMAAEENNRVRAEYRVLEEKLKRVEAERAGSKRALDEQREADLKEEKAVRARLEMLWAEERRELSAQLDAARESIARLEKDAAKRQAELEQQIADTNKKAVELIGQERAAAKAERQANQWASERSAILAELAAAREDATQMAGNATKRPREMSMHHPNVEPASHIMSGPIHLNVIPTMIQGEVQAGMTLAEAGAGRVLTEEGRYEREITNLRKELETVAAESERALRAGLELERKAMEAEIQRVEDDRAKLERALAEQREAERREVERKEREEEKAALARLEKQWAEERRELSAQLDAARENVARLEEDAAKRQPEQANRRTSILAKISPFRVKARQNQHPALTPPTRE